MPRDARLKPSEAPQPGADFQVIVERHTDGLQVQITGDLDIATAPELNRLLDGLLDQAPARMSFDLEQVPFMDCRGLSALLRAQQAAIRDGGQLTLRCTATQVRRLLELTRLVEQFAFE